MSLLKVNTLTDLGGDAPTIPPYAGQILQVVSTTKTDAYSLSLASNTISSEDVTGLTATITPQSATSKVLVFAKVNVGGPTNDTISVILFRGGSVLTAATGDAASGETRTTSASELVGFSSHTMPVMFLDSPATTSATTYSFRLHQQNAATQTIFVNRTATGSRVTRNISSITVMEVAG
jgi:hypothetical protein